MKPILPIHKELSYELGLFIQRNWKEFLIQEGTISMELFYNEIAPFLYHFIDFETILQEIKNENV